MCDPSLNIIFFLRFFFLRWFFLLFFNVFDLLSIFTLSTEIISHFSIFLIYFIFPISFFSSKNFYMGTRNVK